jgi:hypothetical protein
MPDVLSRRRGRGRSGAFSKQTLEDCYRFAVFQLSPLRPRAGSRNLLPLAPAVKVVGLPRSGTNWVTRLVTTNFRAYLLEVEESGWKHGPLVQRPYIRHLVMVRSIPVWLDAFYRWEQIHRRSTASSLPQFAESPVTHPRLAAEWGTTSLPELWVRAHRAYLEAARHDSPPVVIISYERLVADLDGSLRAIARELALAQTTDGLTDFTERADNWATPEPRRPINRRAGIDSALADATAWFRDAIEELDRPLVERVTSCTGG